MLFLIDFSFTEQLLNTLTIFTPVRHILAPSGGLVIFGLLGIIMDIFKIASYVGYLHCDSAVKVAFPVVQLVFILVQVKITEKTSMLL